MARVLVVGGATPARDQRPVVWEGHSFVQTRSRFDTFGDHTSPARDEVRIDEANLAAFVAEARTADVVLAETRECLLLWARLPAAARPAFVVLDQDALAGTAPVRRYLAVTDDDDPWTAFVADRATAFVVNTEAHRAPLIAAGVPADRIFPFPSSTGAFELLEPDAAAMWSAAALERAGQGLPADVVVAAGSGQRDPYTFLAAARSLQNIQFVFIDPTLPRHEAALRQAQLWPQPNVVALAPLPLPRFAALLAQARIVVVALVPGEAAGGHLTVALAHRAGTPVVASDVPGLKGYLTAGRDGCLVPPADPAALADAIAALWPDATRRAAFGAAGRAREDTRVVACRAGLRAALAHALAGRAAPAAEV